MFLFPNKEFMLFMAAILRLLSSIKRIDQLVIVLLTVSKILFTICGIGWGWEGVYRENMAEKIFKIELET